MAQLNKLAIFNAVGATIMLAGALNAASAADLSVVPSGSYKVDPTHAYIHFQYNHLGLSNPTLSFDDFTVELNLDSSDPTKSMVMVTIDAGSVVTGSEIWKEHLTGEDWLDVVNNPQISFQSKSIEAADDGTYQIIGDVTVKGQTQPLTLDVTINAAMNHPVSGKPVFGLDASGSLLRSDFGLGKLAPNVSDEVAVNITAEMVKAE